MVGLVSGIVWLQQDRGPTDAEPGGNVIAGSEPDTTPVPAPSTADEEEAATPTPSPQGTFAPPVPTGPAVEQSAPTPTAVRVASLDVESSLIPLGVDDDNRLEVPAEPQQAGWWEGGPEPGEQGPAVIVGHVDDYRGPGIFLRLHQVQPGDEIEVDREDGSTLTYTVTRVEQHPKDDFPTEAVYGATDGTTLRLVTCGGTFDEGDRSYRDNVIVFAEPTPQTLADLQA